jgi:hypothetical protein
VATEAEAVRSSLDDVQQAGFALRETSMQFGETFADSFVQQLLGQPLGVLANTSFSLNDAQYAAAEVCSGYLSILPWPCKT